MVAGALSTLLRNLTTASLVSAVATGGTAPYTYQWYRSTTSGFTPGGGNILGGQTALQLDDTGLTQGVAYYYKVVATDNVSATATSAQMTVYVRYLVVCDGDSLTGGTGNGNYPTPLADLLPNAAIINAGIGSNQLTYMVNGGPNPFFASSVRVDPYYTPAVPCLVVFWAGRNDLVVGATDVQVYANDITYAQQRLAVGWKLVTLTILPAAPSQFTPQVIIYQNSINASLRANFHDWAHGLADVRANPLIGPDGADTDLTYYEADQIHLNDTGAAVVAGIVAQAVNGVIGPQSSGIALH